MNKLIWFIIIVLIVVWALNYFSKQDKEKVVEQTEVGVASYTASGTLTIRDITNPVEFKMIKTQDGRFVGTASVDRTLYDVKFGSTKFFAGLGDGVVNDVFTLDFDLVPGEPLETPSGATAINTQESKLSWAGTKTLIANYTDSGTIDLESGFIVFGEAGDPVSGEAVIDMTTIKVSNTGRGGEEQTTNMLTNHLSSDDFFNVEMYPTAKVVISSIVSVEE